MEGRHANCYLLHAKCVLQNDRFYCNGTEKICEMINKEYRGHITLKQQLLGIHYTMEYAQVHVWVVRTSI